MILGLVQGFAIIAGVSRAGATIVALLFLGLKKEEAFRISFLASIPAVFGALILEAKDLPLLANTSWLPLVAGFVISFLSGLFTLTLLKKIIQQSKLHYFGYYCLVLGVVVFLFYR